jgi:hypothetical protein
MTMMSADQTPLTRGTRNDNFAKAEQTGVERECSGAQQDQCQGDNGKTPGSRSQGTVAISPGSQQLRSACIQVAYRRGGARKRRQEPDQERHSDRDGKGFEHPNAERRGDGGAQHGNAMRE